MTARSEPTHATLLLLLLLFAGALSATPALSLAEMCSVTQVTDLDPGSPQPTSYVNEPVITADGAKVFFVADGDPAGTNPDGDYEVYEVDLGTLALTQVTTTADALQKQSLVTDVEGNRVAFVKRGILAIDSEVVVVDRVASSVVVHNFGAGTYRDLALDGAGQLLYFLGNVDPGDNPERNDELFVLVAPGDPAAVLQQISDTDAGAASSLSVSADGKRVVFASTHDLGSNPDGGEELFLYRRESGSIEQLLDLPASAEYGPLVISAEGQRIAFASFSDLTGSNPDGNSELFLLDVPTVTIAQLTATDRGGTFDPFLGFHSHRIAFESDRDLVGENIEETAELFLFDRGGTFSQATDSSGPESIPPEVRGGGDGLLPRLAAGPLATLEDTYISLRPQTDRKGGRIVFRSNRDHTGGNDDGSVEIFLAECSHATRGFEAGYDAGLGSLPSAQGWQHVLNDPDPDDFLSESNYAVAGGELLQGSTAGPSGDSFNAQYYRHQALVPFDFASDRLSVVLELQILYSTLHHPMNPVANRRAGFGVWLADAVGRSVFLFIGDNQLFLLGENEHSSGLQPFDSTDGFHRYEIEVSAAGAQLRIDGSEVASLPLAQFRLLHSALNSVLFGDLTQNESSSSRLRSVTLSATEIPVFANRDPIFADGFESGDLSRWGIVP